MKTERECCHIMAALLAAHDITEVVLSPGSRNAPLIEAIDSIQKFNTTVVIDERSAAFVALGKASITQHCVVLICTSGTALLNYAPAIAEARYRNIPLLAITADRPHEWINRNDSQTIEQPEVYKHIIKQSFKLDSRDSIRHQELVINDAINTTLNAPYGPVHLNIEIPDPSIETVNDIESYILGGIEQISPSMLLPQERMTILASRLQAPTKVMIVAGCHAPDQQLNRAISRLCSYGNFITLAESISNLHGNGIITTIDTVLSSITKSELDSLKPDIVISHGGAILSTQLKSYLRDNHIEHWHVGITPCAQDTYCSMTLRIETTPAVFYRQLAAAIRRNTECSDYTSRWTTVAERAIENAKQTLSNIPWCDLKAVVSTLSMVPSSYNIQLSNGMSVRYAQILPSKFHRVDCNRGVSGIEGSTSTAIGASTMYRGDTLLITGDMSASYDLNALLLQCKSPRFKMVVIQNGGGGIFNYIKGTRDYKNVDKYMVAKQVLPIGEIASVTGFSTFTATNERELKQGIHAIIAETEKPAILIVKTSAIDSAIAMRQFIKRNKQ